jgi:hypothetical protein
VDLPGQEGGGSGSSVLKYPSGGPVLAATVRPFSVPVGPTAPATPLAGPVGLAWLNPQSPDFYRQLSFDIDQQIAYNNALWEAAAPIREQVAHWYGKGLSTPAKDQMWWEQVGGEGRPPIGFGYWGPRNWAGAGEQQGAEVVNYGLGAAGLAKGAIGMIAGLRGAEAGAAEGIGWAEGRAAELAEMIPEAQQGRVTMAAGLARDPEPGELVKLIGTSEPNGRIRVGVILESDEVVAPGVSHAEQDIVAYARANGLQVIEIAATRPICPNCIVTTFEAGGLPLGPLKIRP